MISAVYSNSARVPAIALPTLTPAGVIDILVVAFLIYQALMIVKGTRAGHILIGTLTWWPSTSSPFTPACEVLRSVLSYIVPYLALAVIVLFQSEIRRTLARLGRKTLVRARLQTPRIHRRHRSSPCGAFRRKDRCALSFSNATSACAPSWKAESASTPRISRDLLLAIFLPGDRPSRRRRHRPEGPDRGRRLLPPLTTNPALSSDLGTRHRAAIGITEETDCLSLVVSEETGRISVAAFGELTPASTSRSSMRQIASHFGVNTSAPSSPLQRHRRVRRRHPHGSARPRPESSPE